jgi:hypothetical protein
VPYPFSHPTVFTHARDMQASARLLIRRIGAALYVVGGLTMVLTLLAPSAGRPSALAFLPVGAACFALAAFLWFAPRVPDWLLLATPPLGTLLVTAIMSIEGTTSGTPFFYLWPMLVAAYFFQRWQVLLNFALMCAAFAVALAFWVPVEDGRTIMFLDTAMAVGVVAALVYMLKTQVGRLVTGMHKASTTDALTGTLNRGAFQQRLQDALAATDKRPRSAASSRRLDGDPTQQMRHAVARVDPILDPLEDVLPADHHHRVHPAVEQRRQALAEQPVALVLEPLDLAQVWPRRGQVLDRGERRRHLAAGRGERVGQRDRLVHRRLDSVEAEEVARLLGIVDHVVQSGGERKHVAALERHRQAQVEVVRDVVRDRVVGVLELHEPDALLEAVRPRSHQVAQQGGRELHVAPRPAQHPVQLAEVGRAADELRKTLGRDGCSHDGTVGTESPAQVTKR